MVLEEYLIPLNPSSPKTVLVLDFYAYISRLICHNRVRIKEYGFDVFPNLYGLIFLPSSTGKDRPLAHLNVLFSLVFSEQKRQFQEFKIKEYEHLRQEAEQMGIKKEEQKRKFIEDRRSHDLANEVQNATVEGLSVLGASFVSAGFGSLHFANSEFIDFIEEKDGGGKTALISYLKEVYEDGTSKIKVVKKDKVHYYVIGVPHTMLVHSSLAGLFEDDKKKKTFKDFLNRGLGRRSLVCFPEKFFEFHSASPEERIIRIEKAEKAKIFLTDYLLAIHKTLAFHPFTEKPKEVLVSNEVFTVYCAYENEKHCEFAKLASYEDEGAAGDVMDRPRKAMRLACLIAVSEHPDDLVIRPDDFLFAQELAEHFGSEAMRLSRKKEASSLELMREEILSSQEKNIPVTKTVFREMKCAPSQRDFKKWLNEILPEMPEFCAERDEVFLEEAYKTGRRYSIHKHQESFLNEKAVFSLTQSSFANPADGYERKEVLFSDLAQTLMAGNCYSPAAIFRGKHRLGENIEEMGNCIMLDIDHELPFEEVKKKVMDFRCLLLTTDHHQKEKGNEPPMDRFRVIFLCDSLLNPLNGFDRMSRAIIYNFGLESGADFGASVDRARYFKPSPSSALAWHSPGRKLLNWRMFDIAEKKKEIPLSWLSLPRWGNKHVLEQPTFETKHGEVKRWEDFVSLEQGKTFPVRCIFPEQHKNGDKNPSAFIGRHFGGSLMFKCTACGALGFEK